MTRAIVFATDFSAESKAAMPHAIELARLWKAPLRLMHVIEADAPGGPWLGLSDALDIDVGERVATLLDELAAKVSDSGVEVQLVNRRGVPADEILAELALCDARAVVVGSHGFGGFRQFFIGSVATRVTRGADCPVLVVPPKSPPPPWTSILYPTDFSALCNAVFPDAVALAAAADAPLEIFHVEVPHDSALMAYGMGDVLLLELEAERERLGQRMGALSEKARKMGVEASEVRVIGHRPGRGIVGRALGENHGMIIMPANGRRGFERFMYGSVTEEVMRHIDRPLMVLPGTDAAPAE